MDKTNGRGSIKRPRGRPCTYTPKIAKEICAQMAAGKSLRSICEAKKYPAEATVRLWAIEDRDGFAAQYACARELQADFYADEIIDIADDKANDYILRQNEDGSVTKTLDSEHVQRSRLRIDTRKWKASKMYPRRYGDKIAVGGSEDMPAVKIEQIKRVIVDPE